MGYTPHSLYVSGGDDYQPVAVTLTLGPFTDPECIEVIIVDDDEPEPALEFFSLSLSSTDPAVVIDSPLADVAIQNKDSE